MKIVPTLAAAATVLAFSSSAFAETLNYDFSMTIKSISDGYGVFNGLSVGDTINVSTQFNTAGDWDGTANISLSQVSVVAKGGWSSSWSDVQYNTSEQKWDAYSGIISEYLVVNGIKIHAGSVHEEVYLDFGKNSSGEFGLTSGLVKIGVRNGSSADLVAEYVPPPPKTSVPELDPKSGMSTLALLGGGLAVAWSRRRRQDLVAG
jgi:hypothetical protein